MKIPIVSQLQESGYGSRIAGLVGIIWQAVQGDAFFWLFWILCVANLADWWVGRWSARERGEFSRTRSRQGLMEKAIALMVVLIIRSLEAVMVYAIGASSRGWVAAAITAALIYEDVESLDKNRMRMGRKSIPLLSSGLAKLRHLTGAERRKVPRDES